MKTFLISLIVLILVGAGGYFAYQYFQTSVPTTTSQEMPIVTKTGVVQKLPKPGDDYTHTLKTSDAVVKLNSYSVQLDQYVNKTVTVEGQYSGDTLFVDAINP